MVHRKFVVKEPSMKAYHESPEEGGPMNDAMVPVSKNVIDNSAEMNNQTRSDICSRTVNSVEEEDDDGLVVPSHVDEARLYNDISITRCTNVHLGDKIFFPGPVRIENFVCDTPNLLGNISIQRSNAVQSDVSRENFAAAKSFKGVSRLPAIPGLCRGPSIPSNNSDVCCQNCTWWYMVQVTSLVCLVLAIIVTVTIMLSSDTSNEIPPESGYIGRDEWKAAQSIGKMNKLHHPVRYVIIHDTGLHNVSRNCSTLSECSSRVRDIQRFHIEHKKYPDISFNYLVGGDGNIFIGRGWKFAGEHTHTYDDRSIGICFIGDFDSTAPPKQQLEAAQRIIEKGLYESIIAVDYTLEGYRDLRIDKSPGDALYNIIKTWPCYGQTCTHK